MATKFAGTPEQIRVLNAYINLMRAANSVTLRVHRHLRAAKLTVGQFGALEALYHLGAMRQNELTAKLLCSPGNLSTVLTNLEYRQLVRRKADPSDARCIRVEITERGTRLMDDVFPGHVAGLQTALAVLSSAEQETLRSLCRKLGTAQE